jgi:hypothetical protein
MQGAGCALSSFNIWECPDQVDLSGQDLTGCDLSNSQFTNCNLAGADLSGITMQYAWFTGCDVSGALFSGADWYNGVLVQSSAIGAIFAGAELFGNGFQSTNFTNSIFDNANIDNSDFTGSNLTAASFCGATGSFFSTWDATCVDGTLAADHGGTCDGHLGEEACECGVLTRCIGACVDLQTDAAHCGACGNACSAGATCTSGSCTTPDPCGSGESVCGFPLSNAICCDDATEFCCEQICPNGEDRACCPNGYQCAGVTGVGNRCIPPGETGF